MKIQKRNEVFHIYSDTPPTFQRLVGFNVWLRDGDIWHTPDGCVYRWEKTYWHPVKLRTKPNASLE